MNKRIMAIAVLLAGSMLGAQVNAKPSSGVMSSLNVYSYSKEVSDSPGGDSKMSTRVYDIKVGYIGASGLYLGGMYTTRSDESGSSTTDGNALAASIGYVGEAGVYIMGHYIVSAKFGDYKEGTGFKADLGYLYMVNNVVFVGAELTYRSIDYKKNDSIPNLDSHKVSETFPMLSVGVVF
ncbi:hypothetical protein [Bdellovibrio sp. GT3]|uniref:hypothetical protein n=1 Tax=Bdellovibrio sp. GT3 TaxID=3136282 RepID=UPI0030F0694F